MSTRYACDYAKRVASCKKCKMQLPKGCLRLAKITPNPFVERSEDKPPPEMKGYFHPNCLFETFYKARAATKVVDEAADIEDWDQLKDEDKEELTKLIEDLAEVRNKNGAKTPKKAAPPKNDASSEKKTPKSDVDNEGMDKQKKSKTKPEKSKDKEMKDIAKDNKEKSKEKAVENIQNSPIKKDKSKNIEEETTKKSTKNERAKVGKENLGSDGKPAIESSKYNSFYKFCQLCEIIGNVSKGSEKTKAVNLFVNKEKYDGHLLTFFRLLLPEKDERVFNLKDKQIAKYFSTLYDLDYDALVASYKNSGDVSMAIKKAMENKHLIKNPKSDWSILKVDRWLNKLIEYTEEEDIANHLKFASKRLGGIEILFLIRLLKKDLRINASTRHILEGLHPNAYEVYQGSRNISDVINKYNNGELKKIESSSAKVEVGKPVLPMLTEALKTMEDTFKKFKNGARVELKYDGERVQVHKIGNEFSFYARNLKPVDSIKTTPILKFLPQAFPFESNCIIDAELAKIDKVTGRPYPLSYVSKMGEQIVTCLFVFDILLFGDEVLTNKSLEERQNIIADKLKTVSNRVVAAPYWTVSPQDTELMRTLIYKTVGFNMEGLVVKGIASTYQPGHRDWIKLKCDHLKKGLLPDTLDLIFLGAYFGDNNRKEKISNYLLGAWDSDSCKIKAVAKGGLGLQDEDKDKINDRLMNILTKVEGYDSLPTWVSCADDLLPDFIVKNPKASSIWEVSAAECSQSNDVSSVRFPLLVKFRNDKPWSSATSHKDIVKLIRAKNSGTSKFHIKDDLSPPFNPYCQQVCEEEDNDDDEEKALHDKPKSSKDYIRTMSGSKIKLSDLDDCLNESSYETLTEDLVQKESDITLSDDKRNKRKFEDDDEDESNVKRKKTEDKKSRVPCQYGASCYRKNPQHKAEFSHPNE